VGSPWPILRKRVERRGGEEERENTVRDRKRGRERERGERQERGKEMTTGEGGKGKEWWWEKNRRRRDGRDEKDRR